MKRFSNISAGDLINFMEMAVLKKENASYEDYDVFIDEHTMEICIAHRETGEGDSIGAARIHYRSVA